MYFKNQASEIIFYLVELKGKQQLHFLGISPSHYCNKKVAERWHKEIANLIHPDKCNHPKATQAMQALEKLYQGMK